MVFLVRYFRPVDVNVNAPDAVFMPFASNVCCICEVFCGLKTDVFWTLLV